MNWEGISESTYYAANSCPVFRRLFKFMLNDVDLERVDSKSP